MVDESSLPGDAYGCQRDVGEGLGFVDCVYAEQWGRDASAGVFEVKKYLKRVGWERTYVE